MLAVPTRARPRVDLSGTVTETARSDVVNVPPGADGTSNDALTSTSSFCLPINGNGQVKLSLLSIGVDAVAGGTSDSSWEDAAAQAVRTVRQTIRDVRVAEVVKQDIHLEEDGGITYRSKLQISFKYESDR